MTRELVKSEIMPTYKSTTIFWTGNRSPVKDLSCPVRSKRARLIISKFVGAEIGLRLRNSQICEKIRGERLVLFGRDRALNGHVGLEGNWGMKFRARGQVFVNLLLKLGLRCSKNNQATSKCV